MSEKKLGDLLSEASGSLGGLAQRAREMQTLTEAIRQALPADLRPHLVSAAYEEAAGRRGEATLVLIAESSAWASRLRFCAEQAQAAARTLGLATRNCRVRVRPGPE